MNAQRLFICTDLDRTLIPNGPQPESPQARRSFARLAARPEVSLAYVSGRHRELVQQAIATYALPAPDFVVGDVGSTIYHVGAGQDWQRQQAWEEEIAGDWAGFSHADIRSLLKDMADLRLQESVKQNHHKLSYYVPLQSDRQRLDTLLKERLQKHGIHASLIWSADEPAGIGLLDVLPQRATKYHAVRALMRLNGFDEQDTVFCGDSGNDMEVLVSSIPAVLVANSQLEIREQALQLSRLAGQEARLYVARGGLMGMNGNYAAGILEGIAHYHPGAVGWMGFAPQQEGCA